MPASQMLIRGPQNAPTFVFYLAAWSSLARMRVKLQELLKILIKNLPARVHSRQCRFRPSDQCFHSGQRKNLLCEFIPIEGEVNEDEMSVVDIPVKHKSYGIM